MAITAGMRRSTMAAMPRSITVDTHLTPATGMAIGACIVRPMATMPGRVTMAAGTGAGGTATAGKALNNLVPWALTIDLGEGSSPRLIAVTNSPARVRAALADMLPATLFGC